MHSLRSRVLKDRSDKGGADSIKDSHAEALNGAFLPDRQFSEVLRAFETIPPPPPEENITPMPQEDKFFFLCGRCDMLVREEDLACQYCGAQFLNDDPVCNNEEELPGKSDQTHLPDWLAESVRLNRALERTCTHSAKRVDVIGLLSEKRTGMGIGNTSGGASSSFSNSAKILERVESIIQQAADFGADTEEAERVLTIAWKECNGGHMERAFRLAEKAKRLLVPSVRAIIEGQIFCLKEAMIEMKRKGRTLVPLIIEMKMIRKALDEHRLDDAIRMTRALMDETRKGQMELLKSTGTGKSGSRRSSAVPC